MSHEAIGARPANAARRRWTWCLLPCVWLLSTLGWAAHYTGTYAHADGATIEIAHDAQGHFTGHWHTQQGSFAVSGHAADDRGGEGSVQIGSDRVAFDVDLSPDGTTLTGVLRSNGTRFEFRRQATKESEAPPRTGADPSRATADPYVGDFRGAQVIVVLEGDGGRYSGRIESAGQAYPVQLQTSGDALVGTFQVGQDRFDVRMTLEGDALVMRTGNTAYHLARHGVGSIATDSTTTQAGLPETLHLRPVTIMDETGFDRPRPALTLMVPHDWTASGGVQWRPRLPCHASPHATFAMASHDEAFRVATITREHWTIANMPMDAVPQGCMAADTGGVRGFLHAWVARERPGARVLGFDDLPEFAAAYGGMLRDDPATGLTAWAEVGEITYALDHRGTTVHERVVAVVVMVESLSTAVDGTVLGYRVATATGTVVRAPEGQLAEFAVLASTLIGLVRADPAWQTAIVQHDRTIANMYVETGRAIHDITMDAQQFVFEMASEGAAGREASRERSVARFREGIRETHQYHDPVANGPVELPDHYAFAWRLEDGTYKVTNDALIVPYRDWGVDGQRIERVP